MKWTLTLSLSCEGSLDLNGDGGLGGDCEDTSLACGGYLFYRSINRSLVGSKMDTTNMGQGKGRIWVGISVQQDQTGLDR